jgi:MFS transporter, OPA family, glycerol-3-phosphate transporter
VRLAPRAELPLNPRYERWRWQIFGITWLIYASYYLTRQSFGVAKVALENDPLVALNRTDFGMVDSVYLTAYMLGQFVFGPLGDRLGPKRILLVGMTLSIAAAVASGFSTAVAAFVTFAAIQGIAQSTGWSNTTKTMSSWFSLNERGRVIGLWCTHYTVGAAVALPFAGWMMGYFGRAASAGQPDSTIIPFWPAAFWAPAAALGIVLVLTWVFLQNRPEDVGLPPIEVYHGEHESLLAPEESTHQPAEDPRTVIREVLATPSIWLLAVSYFSIKLTRYAFYFWGPKYVFESLGSDTVSSAMTAAAMPIGGLVGVIGIGYASDKWFQARRAPVAVISLLATAAIMLVGLTHIDNIWLMAAFFFLVGVFLFGPDSIISGTAAMDFGTKRGAGTATGFVNGIGSIGGILGGFLPGVITSKSDWTALFGVFLVGLLFSAAVLVPLWRTKPPEARP